MANVNVEEVTQQGIAQVRRQSREAKESIDRAEQEAVERIVAAANAAEAAGKIDVLSALDAAAVLRERIEIPEWDRTDSWKHRDREECGSVQFFAKVTGASFGDQRSDGSGSLSLQGAARAPGPNLPPGEYDVVVIVLPVKKAVKAPVMEDDGSPFDPTR